tara:strand:+ start:79 stop:801 length:723 start_codon:yes stop_codon:yes gene_type:complete
MDIVYPYSLSYNLDSYTKKVVDQHHSNSRAFELFLSCLEYAQRFYSITIITDELSYPKLKNLPYNVKIDYPKELIYVDDYKLYAIKKYPNSIIIDPDVVLYKKLNIKEGYDVYVDYNYLNYENGLDVMLESIQDYKDNNYPIDIFNINNVPNLGFLYFSNKKMQKDYIYEYNKIREWSIKNLNYKVLHSTIIGQYCLGWLSENKGYNIGYLKEMNNRYNHFAGAQKYSEKFKVPKLNSLL